MAGEDLDPADAMPPPLETLENGLRSLEVLRLAQNSCFMIRLLEIYSLIAEMLSSQRIRSPQKPHMDAFTSVSLRK